MHFSIKTIIIPILIAGGVLRIRIINNSNQISKIPINRRLVDLISTIWYLPNLATRGFSFKLVDVGLKSTQQIERGWFELLSVK
jgi:hypothetical protein